MTLLRKLLIICFCGAIAACSTSDRSYKASEPPNPGYKIGKPYTIAGKVYRPVADPHYDKTGLASWYGPQFHGRKTANGDVFNMNDLTAAHTTLPMPSYVRVTNVENGRWLILKINDRGPFIGNRLIDVSRRAAQLLGFERKGVTNVRVQAVTGPRVGLPTQTLAQKQQPLMLKTPLPRETRSVGVIQPDPEAQSPSEGPASQVSLLRKKLYIQVGAFVDRKNAQRTLDSVNHISETKIDRVDVKGQNLYRVRVGPHPTVELAEIILGRILSLGHNTARIIMDD